MLCIQQIEPIIKKSNDLRSLIIFIVLHIIVYDKLILYINILLTSFQLYLSIIYCWPQNESALDTVLENTLTANLTFIRSDPLTLM